MRLFLFECGDLKLFLFYNVLEIIDLFLVRFLLLFAFNARIVMVCKVTLLGWKNVHDVGNGLMFV